MPLRPNIVISLLFLLGLAPGLAFALPAGELIGVVLYGTGQYRSEVAGTEAQSARATYEQVAVRYQNRGLLGDTRIGSYALLLGYEFNHLDPSNTLYGVAEGTNESITTAKPFYNASLLVAPGGLPFRLTAYARDLHQSLFSSAGNKNLLPYGQQPPRQDILGDYRTVNDISNGSHREFGATLLAGIRNGSYLGAYRDVFAQLPRLLIDYRQIDIDDDTHDFSRTHTRSRDLAFVSLNKKDNWVHLRMNDFTDFLNDNNNVKTSQVMIGTVDHTLMRQWINLTNWIQISGDLSYTVEKLTKTPDPIEAYNFNFFTVARREKTEATIWSTFERIVQGAKLTQEGDLPIYVSYEADRDSLYRGRFRSNFTREGVLDGAVSGSSGATSSGRQINIDLSADLFRTRPIVFKPRLQLEVYNQDALQVLTEKANLEWANRSDKKNWLWTAGVSITSTQKALDDSTDLYLETGLFGSAEKDLSRSVRAGVRGTVYRGEGSNGEGSLSNRDLELQGSNEDIAASKVDRFLRSDATVFLDQVGDRYGNRLEFTIGSLMTDEDTVTVTEVRHLLERRGQESNFKLKSSLVFGDSVSMLLDTFDYVTAETTDSGTLDFAWSSEARYRYTPDRRMRFALTGRAIGAEGEGNNNLSLGCSEELDYRFFTTNGIVRKLADISEEFGWERVSEGVGDRDSALYLRLTGSVYPTRYFYAKLSSELVAFNSSGSSRKSLGGETGLNFEKMQIALSYAHKQKTPEGSLGEIQEDYWDMKVRKTF